MRVGLWDSFSGGAPVRSHPRLIRYNWCLIRRGCDKLVSERGFSQGIEPRLLCGIVGSEWGVSFIRPAVTLGIVGVEESIM